MSSPAKNPVAKASTSSLTRLWHPFAAMADVEAHEFVLVRGADMWVWTADGRRFLDATASLWYANVGHGRREIRDAIANQLEELETYMVFNDVATPPALRLAERLAELAPISDGRVLFTTGGGEAIETAAKLCRRYWHEVGAPDRSVLISRTASYHGTNGFGTGMSGIPVNREGFGPILDDETIVVERDTVAALEDAIERVGAERVAAFFVEPVIAAGGVYPPAPGYLEGVAETCRRHGILLVVDAVVCGFGRLGNWFGIERWGIEPDLIVFAKGVTSGYLPLGGVVAGWQVAAPFWEGESAPPFRHGPTYSGHSTCCAAALANLDILENDDLLHRGATMEPELLDALRPLASHPLVSEVRGGTGTLAALELAPDALAERPALAWDLTLHCRRHGVLVRPLGASVAVSPPLTTTAEHFRIIATALADSLGELNAARR